MLLTNFEHIYREIFNAIDNPSIVREDIDRIIASDYSLTYSPTFFCIVNRINFSIEYISKNMHSCLGVPSVKLKSRGLRYIWNKIPKEDLECLYASLDELKQHINTLNRLNNKTQYSYSWNYRIKATKGRVLNVLQSTTPFTLTDNPYSRLGMVHFTVLSSKFNIPIRASVNVLKAQHKYETVYSTNCSRKKLLKDISERERDIIKLLAKKHSSKSIGESLCISSKTVDTHRRNILKKLKLKSTGELIHILRTQ